MNPDIFIQGFLARLVPIYHERVLGALRHFNFEAYPQNAALAAVGALLALVIWYGVGVWLRRMPERVSTEEQRARIEAMRSTAREWLPWLLILSPTPLGGVVVMPSTRPRWWQCAWRPYPFHASRYLPRSVSRYHRWHSRFHPR